MSNALAIAGVTAVLKQVLVDALAKCDVSDLQNATVSVLGPDRVATGEAEPNQINIFLYQVTANQGWRNADMPSRDTQGGRTTNPPLALDLHYMLTAYGTDDLHAEMLLGYAMQALHEIPVLTRTEIRTVLNPPPLPDGTKVAPPIATQSIIGLADQLECLKITPVFLTTEELTKLWTAMQARYRPSMAYTASVVLIQATGATKAAPPVLRTGKDDSGVVVIAASFPTLLSAKPSMSDSLPAMRLGDDILLTGTNLNAPGQIIATFENTRANKAVTVSPLTVKSSNTLIAHVPSVKDVPAAINQWAVGLYSVSLQVSGTNLPTWNTNAVAIALAPLISLGSNTAAPGNSVTVTCSPRLLPEQQPVLILGSQTVSPTSINSPVDLLQPTTLTFTVPNVPAGDYALRLRVDGIDSLPVQFVGTPPKLEFDPNQTVTVT